MRTVYLISILSSLFLNSGADAQTFSVKGRVLSDGHGVEFANVVLRPENGSGSDPLIGAVSDEFGRFLIQGVTAGRYNLVVSSIGYRSGERAMSIDSDVDGLTVNLQPNVSTLDEVVVTGTMKEVTRHQSAIPIEVLSPTLFRKNPTPSIFEAMSLVNGVQPQVNCNVCNTGDIRINGLPGPYTMVLIDGMPIVSSLSTVYGLSGIPNSMVKRIEVVKGPASTLYGSEAVGGLINIITKDPQSAPRYQADVFATSLGEVNADISLASSMGKVSTILGINAFDFQVPHDINDDNFTDLTLQRRISIFNKWTYKTRSAEAGSIAGRFLKENRWGGELQWTPDFRGTDTYYGESIYTTRYELIGAQPMPLGEDVLLNYSYNYHHQDSYYGTTAYLASQHVGFAQIRYRKVVGKNSLLAGIPIRYTYYNDNTAGTASSTGVDQPSHTVLPGIFVQDELAISPRLTILGGARYDHHNVHGGIFTPRWSIKYSPGANGVLRLTGGSGYRVVNLFTEDHAALTGSRTVEIRSALQPERSWNTNLNYTHQFVFRSGFLSADASLFYTRFQNQIIGDFTTNADKIIFDNLDGHAVSRGVTVSADLALSNGFKLIAGTTFMDVFRVDRTTTGGEKQEQLYAPRFSGTFTSSYSTVNSKWSVDLTGRVTGPMLLPVQVDDYRPGHSPLYAILNVQATRHIYSGSGIHWEVYGGAKNLLNYVPRDPLMRPFDPFDRNIGVDNPNGYTFDTAYNYAPMQGIKLFLGVRMMMH